MEKGTRKAEGQEPVTADEEGRSGRDKDRAEDRGRQKAEIEAILFSMGESVPADTIAEAIRLPVRETESLLAEMAQAYEAQDRGIRLARLEDRWQLCSKKELYPVLIRIASKPQKTSITEVLMETLSIIAYKQPVTKAEIERIRGVKCDHAVNKLLEYDLVQEVGRLDAPGRPILLGTTEEFLRHFGTDSVDHLPLVNPAKVEDFKAEAEEEANVKLGI